MEELNPLLHSQLRLAIMTLLIANEQISFNFILDKTGATRGNVSVQIKKLEEAGYIEVKKTYQDRKPLTLLRVTPEGEEAMEEYTRVMKEYLGL